MPGRRNRRSRRTRRRNRMCREKVTYWSEVAAMDAATRTGNTWYRCPYCHGFHLTSRYHQPGGGPDVLRRDSGHDQGDEDKSAG